MGDLTRAGDGGDEEKGDAENSSLLDHRVWRAGSLVDEETSQSGVRTARIVSSYAPMQGLEIVRAVICGLMTLPCLVMIVLSFVAMMLQWSQPHLGSISVAGVMVLFLNVLPWCVIATGAQCLLSLKPDLIAAQVQVKRLRPEVGRLLRDLRQELSKFSIAELKVMGTKAGTNEPCRPRTSP